jgi:hypothetical protein
MFLSCKRATELISESLDGRLPLYAHLRLKLHLLHCRFCARCREQMLLIREVLRRLVETEKEAVILDSADVSLSPLARERIRSALLQGLGR